MRVLFVTARLPFPPRKGDATLAFHRARHLDVESIDLLTLVARHEKQHVDSAARYFRSVFPIQYTLFGAYLGAALRGLFSRRPFQVLLFDNRRLRRFLAEHWNDYDIIDFYTIRTTSMIPPGPGIDVNRVVVDFIDSLQLNLKRRLSRERNPLTRLLLRVEERRVAAYERELLGTYKRFVLVSKDEVSSYAKGTVYALPLGVYAHSAVGDTPPNGPPIVTFHGNMGYSPNVEAVVWFVHHCWEAVRARIPDAEFWVFGTNPSRKVLSCGRFPGVRIAGKFDDLAVVLSKSTVAVAPMQTGTGMQNKVLESLALGIPTVATSLGRGSIEVESGRHIVVADSEEQFASAVSSLILNAEKRKKIGEAGRSLVLEKYTWERHCERLLQIYKR